MLVGRLFCYSLVLIGMCLVALSLLNNSISYFYWSLGCYVLATLTWLTIQMLYIEPFNADTCQRRHRWVNLLGDIGNSLEIIAALPKFILNVFIRLI